MIIRMPLEDWKQQLDQYLVRYTAISAHDVQERWLKGTFENGVSPEEAMMRLSCRFPKYPGCPF